MWGMQERALRVSVKKFSQWKQLQTARCRLKTSFKYLSKDDSQGIRGPLICPISSPSRHQSRILEGWTLYRALNVTHRPFPVLTAASYWKPNHKVQLFATSAESRSVCWAGTEIGSKERPHRPRPGTLGSREPRRQTLALETEARAAPADWSEIRPIRVQGEYWRLYPPSPDGLVHQPISAPHRGSTRPTPSLPGETRATLAFQDQVPEDLNTYLSSTVKFRGGAGLAYAQRKPQLGWSAQGRGSNCSLPSSRDRRSETRREWNSWLERAKERAS